MLFQWLPTAATRAPVFVKNLTINQNFMKKSYKWFYRYRFYSNCEHLTVPIVGLSPLSVIYDQKNIIFYDLV